MDDAPPISFSLPLSCSVLLPFPLFPSLSYLPLNLFISEPTSMTHAMSTYHCTLVSGNCRALLHGGEGQLSEWTS